MYLKAVGRKTKVWKPWTEWTTLHSQREEPTPHHQGNTTVKISSAEVAVFSIVNKWSTLGNHYQKVCCNASKINNKILFANEYQ